MGSRGEVVVFRWGGAGVVRLDRISADREEGVAGTGWGERPSILREERGGAAQIIS